jgi:hypothetical protein
MYSPITRRSTSTSPIPRGSIQLRKCANPNAYVRCVYDPRPQQANHLRNSLASPAPTLGPLTENRAPERPAGPRSTSTANAPATPTNPFLVADAQATYPVGRITRQALSQIDPLPGVEQLPLEPPCEPLTGDSHADLLQPLGRLAADLGYTVSFENIAGATGGWCDSNAKRIVIDSSQAVNGQVRVLVHEIVHALGVTYQTHTRPQAEVIVDTATLIIVSGAGLDTSGETVPYVAGWGETGALEAVTEHAELIDRLARTVEEAIATNTDDTDTESPVTIAN